MAPLDLSCTCLYRVLLLPTSPPLLIRCADSRKRVPHGPRQPHVASNPRDPQRAQVRRVLLSPLCFIRCRSSLTFSFFHRAAVNSARFATVMFMFRHRGRVCVALSDQDVVGGGVDRLFDEAIAAGAEDFDQVSGTGQGVEAEVTFWSLLSWDSPRPRPISSIWSAADRSCVHRMRWER